MDDPSTCASADAADAALTAVTARVRDVVAALAADPSALDGSAVAADDADGAALTAALTAAVDGLAEARAELRAALTALEGAAGARQGGGGGGGASADPARAAAADALEPAVAALRAEVGARNCAARDCADALAALVADVDSWREAGAGKGG